MLSLFFNRKPVLLKPSEVNKHRQGHTANAQWSKVHLPSISASLSPENLGRKLNLQSEGARSRCQGSSVWEVWGEQVQVQLFPGLI